MQAENCAASADDVNAHMQTRVRLPVSPREPAAKVHSPVMSLSLAKAGPLLRYWNSVVATATRESRSVLATPVEKSVTA